MEKLLQTYQPFVSKTLRFDTTKALAVLGKGLKEVDAEMSQPFPLRPAGRAVETWADPRIDCGELEVDCETAIGSRWGRLSGDSETAHSPGWIGYLERARDEMERNTCSQASEYLD